MKPKAIALLVGVAVFLGSSVASADVDLPSGHVRLTTGPGELIAPNGQRYYLPVGTHILDGTTYQKLDDTIKTTQDDNTRLKAENDSLKKSLSSWTPGWGTLIVLTTLTIAVGGTAYYLDHH